MRLSRTQILALVLAAGYVLGAYFHKDGGVEACGFTALCMIFPLGCIFASHFMSQHSRRIGSHRPQTPAMTIRLLGWVLLILSLIIIGAGAMRGDRTDQEQYSQSTSGGDSSTSADAGLGTPQK